jgi:MFS family permease
MGVASLQATERFDVAATALSTLAVAQLVVYALMQIPVGILLDRFGARALLVFGAVSMSVGQYLVSVAEVLSLAVLGRMFVGFGDAFVFISVIRLVNGWYEGPKATRVQQLTTNIGQLGQAVSAIPFALLLQDWGWNSTFMLLSGFSLAVVFIGLVFIVNDRPGHQISVSSQTFKVVLSQLIENVRHPGVRMAFWTHFTLQSAPSVFLLLWGYPFLVQGQGFSTSSASWLLSSFVIVGFFVGPIISWFCARYPKRRSFLVLLTVVALTVSWALVIGIPGTAPVWVIVILCFVLATSGPMSMIAFDYTKGFVNKSRLGSASGFVNIGGFTATFSMMFLAGVILDVVKASTFSSTGEADLYSLVGFKWAMSVQFLALVLGTSMFLVERRKARNKLFLDEGITLRPLRVVLGERISRKKR